MGVRPRPARTWRPRQHLRYRACLRDGVAPLPPPPQHGLPPAPRRAKGAGSLREVRPNTWELTLVDPTTKGRRHFETVHGSRHDAEAALDRLRRLLHRDDLGDIRVRELIGRYLDDIEEPANSRDRHLLAEVIQPTIGADLAARITAARIENALEADTASGTPPSDARDAVRLVRRAYQWARDLHWHDDNPAADIEPRWLGR